MKNSKNPVSPLRDSVPKGFALVVTLTLMVLLSILALGLLSLSSVSLRTSRHTNAEAVSRANALLALQLAIGDLQTHLGPDQRISATGSVTGDADTVKQKNITGVWNSRKLGVASTPADFDRSGKTDLFRKWLVSGADQDLLSTESYALQELAEGGDNVDLVTVNNGGGLVRVKKVKVAEGGQYAYAVLDEGVKARINTGVKTPANVLAEQSTILGSGQRPSLAGMEGIGGLPSERVDLATPEGRQTVAKMVSMKTSEFSYGSVRGGLTEKFHDLTTSSMGVLADSAGGGLKRDINLLADTQNHGGLPTEYVENPDKTKVGIYEKELGSSPKPDPLWSRALGWANIFNTNVVSQQTVGGLSIPTVTATSPPGWEAGLGVAGSSSQSGSTTVNGLEAPGPVLLPAIAKVQMSFALAARDMYVYPADSPVPPDVSFDSPPQLHAPQANWYRRDNNSKGVFNSPVDYMLHLIYTPIVTLHNPYNVPLKFDNLRVELVNVPFAVKIFRKRTFDPDFIAQTFKRYPFANMNPLPVGLPKRFGLLMSDTLLPGEVKIYTPAINPNKTWDKENRPGGGSGKKSKFDFIDYVGDSAEDGRDDDSSIDTSRALATPGWKGEGVGYSIDALCRAQRFPVEDVPTETGTVTITRAANIPLSITDRIYAEFAPLPDSQLAQKKFSVEMTLNWQAGVMSRSSAYVFEYSGYNDLRKAIIDKNPQRAPETGGLDEVLRAPKGSDSWLVTQLHDHSTVPLQDMSHVQPIALFSAYAKTGMTGDPTNLTGVNGIYPAKPFAFQNQSAVAVNQKLQTSVPAHYSHELALSRFPEGGLGFNADTGRGRFLSGNSATTGRHFGSLFEIPLAPFQSLVTLNSAQLAAGTSLPHFLAPVGNSYAHPLLEGSQPKQLGAEGLELADHSFLLNSALFDSYYLSGIQTHAPVSKGGDGKSAKNLIEEFVASADPAYGTPSPLPDPRLRAYLPGGETPVQAQVALEGPEGYKVAASHQLVEGAFNVNSTSVAAWKAMISSLTGDGAKAFLAPLTTSADVTLTKQDLAKKTDAAGARFSRLRVPGGQADRKNADGFWRGPIDIDATQLDALAREIVAQVKLRGPFLSVGEFVNRQLGSSESNPLAFSGAIQSAIDKTNINEGISVDAKAGYVIGKSATAGFGFATPSAVAGESTQGAPGFLMQSDVLAVFGNSLTVHSDTFTIRTYGEAVDKNGKITARSYCEAVVQRLPEFVDGRDSAESALDALTSDANKSFGRRFGIVSLKWLSPTEI